MSGAVSDVLSWFRTRAPRLPSAQILNSTGAAGPRRLAVIILVSALTLVGIVAVAVSGREPPKTSQDARLTKMDPLPGGLHSTPEQDALALVATDKAAKAALGKGVSYTPPMAPSQPADPLPPPPDPQPAPRPAAPHVPVFVGRPVRPSRVPPSATAQSEFPAPAKSTDTAPQMRPMPVAAAVDPQAQEAYNRKIGDLFSQWGGRVPRTDVILPQSQADSADPPGNTGSSSRALNTRGNSAAVPLPVSNRDADAGTILVPAGRGIHAHPVLALNSEQSSPAIFQADSGPLAGDRMIGTFSKQQDRLVIHISSIAHNGEDIGADGVVIAPDTMEASVASKVEQNYAARFILPAAAAFVAGLGQAIATTSNTAAVLSPFGGVTTQSRLNLPQQLGIAAGAASQQIGAALNQQAPKGPTISLEANVSVGVIFLTNVTSHHR